jgi:hypothetical protein
MMPHDLPPWRVLYDPFSTWRINQVLRERYRTRRGRDPLPMAAVIDSQSVKMTASGGATAGIFILSSC